MAQFCIDAACVTPDYNGSWLLSASPEEQDPCGLGTSSFPDQVMDLTIVGGQATGVIEVLGFKIVHSGTLSGKHLQMTSVWIQGNNGTGVSDITHNETMDVMFTSPTTFEGLNSDKFELELFEVPLSCTLVWDVSGVKQ